MLVREIARFQTTYLYYDSWNRDAQGNIQLGAPVKLGSKYLTSLPSHYTTQAIAASPELLKYFSLPLEGFSEFSSAENGGSQQNEADRARNAWSNYANITWTFAQDPTAKGVLTFGNIKLRPEHDGVGFYPNYPLVPAAFRGNIWINSNGSFPNLLSSPLLGNWGYTLLLHEIGHALGLTHDGRTAEVPPPAQALPQKEAETRYTVMTYPLRDVIGSEGPLPITPMVYDIAQIQRLYGAKATNAGDETAYTFTDNSHPYSDQAIAKFKAPGAVQMTLWDAGGTGDVIDASQMSTAVFIDLMPGAFSSIGGYYNVAIALNPSEAQYQNNYIEKAVGGLKADRIIGNAGVNELSGNAGKDVLDGGTAADIGVGTTPIGRGDGENDLLIGGGEEDEYVVRQGGGLDTLRDAGANKVTFKREDNSTVAVSTNILIRNAPGATTGTNSTNGLTWELIGNSLKLIETSTQAQALIEDFQQSRGDFGIRIRDPQTAHNYEAPGTPISGDGDSNSLSGTAGAELIQAFAGDDTVNAGAGDDIVEVDDGTDFANGEAGFDRLYGGFGNDQLYGGDDDDELYGGSENDILEGGAGYDNVAGESGRDIVVGNAGDDEISADAQFVLSDLDDAITAGETQAGSGLAGEWLDGGEGEDVALGAQDSDYLAGGGGADVLVGAGGDDNFFGDEQRTLVDLNWSATRNVITVDSTTSYELVLTDASTSTSAAGSGDEIYGGMGSDWVHGQLGDDYIDGGADNDVLFGDQGFDALFGGSGDDVIGGDEGGLPASMHGDDYLDGEDGNDTLYGDGGSDEIFGGTGSDQLHGDNTLLAPADQGSDYLDGEAGDDTLVGYGGDDVLIGDQGNDQLFGGDGNDDLDGGTGIDQLDGGAGDDVLAGGDFGDTLVGGAGDDQLDGEDGVDSIEGSDGADILFGGVGADRLQGGSGDDQLDGGDDDDIIIGDDTPPSTQGNDVLFGGAGNDQLAAGGGADFLDGGEGIDDLFGEAGADFLEGGAGDDFLWGDADNTPLAEQGNDYLSGGDGNDQLVAHAGADTLDGGAGTDTLFGDDGDDLLDGGDGEDDLLGGEGSDVLAGGAGDDALEGGPGSDRYVLNTGDAHDTIYNGGLDTVTFGEGIQGVDRSLWQSGADLVIGNASGSDTLTVANWYVGSQHQVSVFEFADASTWSSLYANDEAAKDKRGTSGADSIFGIAIDESIRGFEGNDQLFGNGGNDTLDGGPGDDTSNGGSGSDTYLFNLGDGRDRLQESGSGADALIFGAGLAKADFSISRAGNDLVLTHTNGTDRVTVQDWFNATTSQIESISFAGTAESLTQSETTDPFLSFTGTAASDFISGGNAYGETILGLAGNDELHGGGGNDSLTGGIGNDSLFGESGNDRYFFVAGDGQDVLTDPTGLNVIQFGPNLVDKVSIAPSGFDDLISFTGTADSVLVKSGGFFPTLAFELYGTNGADNLVGSDFKDIVFALEGNDSVKGGAGVDEIHGGAGNDALEGGLGIDDLWGDAGDDLLDGDLLNDPFATQGGSIGRFRGGPGNDTSYGSTGADSYYFDAGDGQDTIVDEPLFSNGQWHYSLSDDLIFGAGIAIDSIGAHASGADLVVDIGASDRVTLKNWLSDPKYRVDFFRFSDGSSLNESQIADLVNVQQGTPGNDVLTGADTGNDRLYGRAGNDTLSGLGGNDVLDGGTGNDLLDGGQGNDVYPISVGDGTDLIRDSGGADTVSFGAGVSAGDVSLERSANNLVLRMAATNDAVTIENYLKNPLSRVETLLFADGSSLPDAATIAEQLTAIGGTANADNLVGTAYVDRLYGLDGNDTLLGGADDDTLNGDSGADLLAGGSGNDWLAGGVGFDQYQFNAGDASDTLTDPDSDSLVLFGAGITPSSVVTTRTADDLALTISGTADRLAVPGYFVSYPVAEFRFSNGTVWTVDTIKAKVLTGTSGPDTLIGFESDDSISGLAGNDTLSGLSGNDTLDGGTGSDSIQGGNGNDLLLAGTGDSNNSSVTNVLQGEDGDDVMVASNKLDTLRGGNGNDIHIGGTNSDRMEEVGGNNLFYGAAGSDVSWLGDQNDLLVAGPGSDTALGDQDGDGIRGRDVVLFNKTDGGDTVTQLGSESTVSIGGGTTYSNLSFSVSGTALQVKTGGSNVLSLGDWYAINGKRVSTLQIVIEGTSNYNASSSNPMNNKKVQVFDFLGLAAAFDAAGGSFNVAANLPNFRLWGSDTLAIGGAIAYQYARTGSLSALTYDQMRAVLAVPEFAVSGQSITAGAGLMAMEGAESFAESAAFVADTGAQPDTPEATSGERQVRPVMHEVPTPTSIEISSAPIQQAVSAMLHAAQPGHRVRAASAQISDAVAAIATGSRDFASAANGSPAVPAGVWGGFNDLVNLQHLIDAIQAFDGDVDELGRKKKPSPASSIAGTVTSPPADGAGLSSWAVTNALLQYHLAGADDAALGGDQANWGKNDALSGFNLTVALDELTSGSFGAEARQLRPLGGLKEGYTKLA